MRRNRGPAPRLIRRYENRKLYDPEARRYVTLEDLARMVASGEEVRVVDHGSGEDLTNVVLAQVILETVKQRTARIPGEILARLIRLGSRSLTRWGDWPSPQAAAERARDEVERILGGLLARGRLSLDEALALRQQIAEAVQRTVAEAQRGLESRIHALLERSEREGGIGPALRSLRERLMALETYLEEPRPRGRRRAPAASGPDEGPEKTTQERRRRWRGRRRRQRPRGPRGGPATS